VCVSFVNVFLNYLVGWILEISGREGARREQHAERAGRQRGVVLRDPAGGGGAAGEEEVDGDAVRGEALRRDAGEGVCAAAGAGLGLGAVGDEAAADQMMYDERQKGDDV
jgi:hypothetical protein